VLAGRALWQDWRAHSGGAPLIPVLGRMRRWFVRSVLWRKPEVHSVTGHGNAVVGAGTLTASGFAAPPSNAPVDVQMRFVRERLRALEARIGEERQQVVQRIEQPPETRRQVELHCHRCCRSCGAWTARTVAARIDQGKARVP
jgi:hypothetical protein